MLVRVTVIMGIYNCESTLGEAIDSLFEQSFDGWKLVMCDDGSSDNTFSVALEYQNKFPDKILLIRNDKNMGLNYTLNHCLQYVDTEYIARMDGDDISLPDRFQAEIDFLDKHPEYAIVSTPMIYFDEMGDFRTGSGNGEPDIKEFPKYSPFGHAPCMMRTTIMKELNGYSIDNKKLRVEDWDLWIRLYEKGYKGYNLSTPLYKMRDGRAAIKRRDMRSRLNEARIRISAVKKLKLPWYLYVYSLKPIILGMLPYRIYKLLHRFG